MNTILKSAAAGVIAGVPMGIAAQVIHVAACVPRRIPFSRVVRGTERKLGHFFVGENTHQATTWVLHSAYSAAGGAVFGAALSTLPATRRSVAVDVAAGTAFGLAVWGVSYLGWLPRLGIVPAASRDNARFNVMNVVAQAVFGAALGAVCSRWVPARTTARAPR
ncbi:MAG TPA: hypothetical protein VGF99_12805 [Myxococcota bacterium]